MCAASQASELTGRSVRGASGRSFTPQPRERKKEIPPVALLSKEQILKAHDKRYDIVDVPEWGSEENPEPQVRIHSLSGAERDRFESSMMKIDKEGRPVPDMVNSRARLVALSIVDENGKRLFGDSDVLELGGKSAKALDRVFDASARLSGINPEELDKIKEDFGEAQSESSTSD